MDSIFGIHGDALLLRGKRAEILATNLVNVDTPNYKARDIDFGKILAAKIHETEPTMRITDRHDIAATPATAMTNLKYRTPTQPSADGNTVDEQVEQSIYAENAVQYMASLNFINSKTKQLLLALRGE